MGFFQKAALGIELEKAKARSCLLICLSAVARAHRGTLNYTLRGSGKAKVTHWTSNSNNNTMWHLGPLLRVNP